MKYLISFGLNEINPSYYGTDGKLYGCINDIKDIGNWFKPDQWFYYENKQATASAFMETLRYVATLAKEGDTVLINYSGHGTQLVNSSTKEKDKMDEGFCFYDRIVLDKQFSNLVAGFKEGVKVIGFIDACHSGGLSREVSNQRTKRIILPYQTRQFIKLSPLRCSYLGLLAANENQPAMDGEKNGLFTETMLNNFKTGINPIDWLNSSAKKVKVQKFNYKTYGKSYSWKDFKF